MAGGGAILVGHHLLRVTYLLELFQIFRYNGRKTDPPLKFPSEMEEACQYVEEAVNRELRQRTRFPLEWAGSPASDVFWRANVAASNCYEGAKESVGFHSDQMTYLGPYCTIGTQKPMVHLRNTLNDSQPPLVWVRGEYPTVDNPLD